MVTSAIGTLSEVPILPTKVGYVGQSGGDGT
jgi:hypothetical protein